MSLLSGVVVLQSLLLDDAPCKLLVELHEADSGLVGNLHQALEDAGGDVHGVELHGIAYPFAQVAELLADISHVLDEILADFLDLLRCQLLDLVKTFARMADRLADVLLEREREDSLYDAAPQEQAAIASCRGIRIYDFIPYDTGGGVIERAKNIDVLRENGKIFWLTASV